MPGFRRSRSSSHVVHAIPVATGRRTLRTADGKSRAVGSSAGEPEDGAARRTFRTVSAPKRGDGGGDRAGLLVLGDFGRRSAVGGPGTSDAERLRRAGAPVTTWRRAGSDGRATGPVPLTRPEPRRAEDGPDPAAAAAQPAALQRSATERPAPGSPAPGSAAPGTGGPEKEDPRIQLLERRLAKLTKLLEERDAQMRSRIEQASVDVGVASRFTEVQGLRGDSEEVQRKKALMTTIFEANRKLQERVGSRRAVAE